MTDGCHDERFPTLGEEEIARAARFGATRDYAAGEALFRTGDAGIGLFVLTRGSVAITRHDGGGRVVAVADHAPGAIIGETAGLLGRPALVDGVAVQASAVIALDPPGLCALLVADAELGERITRASSCAGST